MRKLLLCTALLALSACLRDIAVVIVCRHYDHRPECQR